MVTSTHKVHRAPKCYILVDPWYYIQKINTKLGPRKYKERSGQTDDAQYNVA